VGNEKNRYLVPDLHPQKMINVTNEPRNAHKKIPQRGNHGKIIVILMEKTIDIPNKKVQDALKKFQHNKNKDHEKTHK
jgi:hypothetical protein